MSSLSLPHPIRRRTGGSTQAARHLPAPQDRPRTLEPGERVLLRGADSHSGEIVLTDRAMHLPEIDLARRHIRWIDIDSVGWDSDRGTTVLTLWPDALGDVERITLDSSRRIATVATEAVTTSQIVRRRTRLTPTVVANITALREPGSPAVCWRIDLSPPTARDQPAVEAAAQRVLAELRALAGC